MTRNSNSDDRTMRSSQPFASATEQELDSMLGMLVPPQPSDTLRARLKRDFAPATPEHVASRAAGRRLWGAFDGRMGGMAVAAALVLAVALGTLVPGTPERPNVATVQSDGSAAFYAYNEDAAVDDDMLAVELADSAPDSAAFMVATFDATTRGTYTNASLLTNASYDGFAGDGGFAELMPLE